MALSESDTRAKLIDPALHACGWTEDLIRREETAGAIDVVDGQPRGRARGRVDYTLRVKVTADAQPVAVALIEAKAEHLPPAHGLEQAKVYAACKRLNVPFVFSSNGHQFVEYDRFKGLTSPPKAISQLPSPERLRARYEEGMGFKLSDPAARPLLVRYAGGEATRRYYQDAAIRADNVRHFGEPVYEYDMSQGIEDGYLAACEVIRRDIFFDTRIESERDSGIEQADLAGKRLTDAITGAPLAAHDARAKYEASAFEDRLVLPERVEAMARDLFDCLVATGGPEQKTIIFCVRDRHADDVAIAMNNLYAAWCKKHGRKLAESYAFKCTAASGGGDYLADLRGGSRHHFVATTVDLLTTGVDVPVVRNIVFFKYVRSPISFYQMVGRGMRLDPATGKLMFRVYDYTNASRLFGESFITRPSPPRSAGEQLAEDEEQASERTILVEGFDVRVTDGGRYIVTMVDGQTIPVTLEEYKQRLAARLVNEAPTLDAFRERWITPADRQALVASLPDAGRSAILIRSLEEMADYDLYDVLAELGYGAAPRTKFERVDAFDYKHRGWLASLPPATTATLKALAGQFARGGTEGLENRHIFETPDVVRAGGLAALKLLARPADVLRETKARLFAA